MNDMTSKQMSDQQRRKVFAEHLQAAVSSLDMRNAYRGPMSPDRAILTSLMEYLEKSPPECPYCHGNDRDAPCAYPSEGKPGCLRDERLADETTTPRCHCGGLLERICPGRYKCVTCDLLKPLAEDAQHIVDRLMSERLSRGQSRPMQPEEPAALPEPVPCPTCSAYVKAHGGPSQVFHGDGPCPPYFSEKASERPCSKCRAVNVHNLDHCANCGSPLNGE